MHAVNSIRPVSLNHNHGAMCSMPDGSHEKIGHVMQC